MTHTPTAVKKEQAGHPDTDQSAAPQTHSGRRPGPQPETQMHRSLTSQKWEVEGWRWGENGSPDGQEAYLES